MFPVLAYGRTLAIAYHEALDQLAFYGRETYIKDWDTKCLETGMTIVVEKPLAEPMISKCFIGGPAELQQYVMEMLDGILDFEIKKGNWAYTYHDRMVNYEVNRYANVYGGYTVDTINQIQFVIDELRSNPTSRRAVVMIRHPKDIGSSDPACIQHIQYQIRDGKLECDVLFRSNDACKASFMNMFALIMLQKRIADVLGVGVGMYVHRVNNFHCYERDFKFLEACNKRYTDLRASCFDNYEGEWQEMMEDAIPDIMKKVEELKKR